MVREFFKNKKLSRTNFKATEALRVGMGVVLNYADKTVELPAAETADNIWVVQKERVPVGEACARTDFSDYEEMFMTVAKGDMAKVTPMEAGDAIGVDDTVVSADAAPEIGKAVSVGADGKWMMASIPSAYVYVEDYNDAGHMLKKIVRMDAAVTN